MCNTSTFRAFSPDLVFQECHVVVECCVGRRQDAHRLHPCPPLQFTLHRQIGKTCQAKVRVLPEISDNENKQTKKKQCVETLEDHLI